MPTPPVEFSENKEMDFHDAWECRYFVSELPQRFKHEELNEFFNESRGPIVENDLYFVTDDIDVDIKLRKLKKPKPTIKVKILLDRSNDFELWRTEIDDGLPVPGEVWTDVLSRLKVEADIELLSSCSEPHQVEEALLTARPNLLYRETWKHRMRYIRPQVEVEVAEVTIGLSFFYSVSFESESPSSDRVRVIRDELSADDLGTPKNYMRLLSQISPK
jgi:hypothetical protein